jgi:septum formation protein
MLVLASASPRRQELLRNARIPFVVQAADVDETPLIRESARDCAERLAREKARAVSCGWPNVFVLGADTVVVVEGEIYGKPRDRDDAARMLRLLSGRTHQVITGVCLTRLPEITKTEDRELKTASQPTDEVFEDVRSETTLVTMSALSDDEIRIYLATEEPMDKAGAYAIQGMASRWISRIDGDYFNVVGLPVALVYGMLRVPGAL